MKKENVFKIAIIVVAVAITGGVVGFKFTQRAQAPTGQATNVQTAPVVSKQEVSNVNVKNETNIVQSTEDVSSWKNYSNNTYDFSLKYPSHLSVGESIHSKELMSHEIVTSEDLGPTLFDLSISKDAKADIINVGIGLSVEELKNSNYSFPREKEGLVSREELTIDGARAVKYTYKNSGYSEDGKLSENVVNVEYQIAKGKYLYLISSFGSDSSYVSILEQIVSTVKFAK